MRRAVVVLVLSTGLIAAGAVPARAASTRAEYIAQVDPICQTFAGPVNAALSAYHRNFKRLGRVAKNGTLKAFVRQNRRTAASLNREVQIEESMLDQIATVPSPAADVATVASWLDYRRQADALAASAAFALKRFKFNVFRSKARQADAAYTASQSAISGFGFQVCGVSV